MEHDLTPLEKAKNMIQTSSPKPKMSWPDRLKLFGTLLDGRADGYDEGYRQAKSEGSAQGGRNETRTAGSL